MVFSPWSMLAGSMTASLRNVMVFRLLHRPNARVPMEVTLLGMMTFSSFEQS